MCGGRLCQKSSVSVYYCITCVIFTLLWACVFCAGGMGFANAIGGKGILLQIMVSLSVWRVIAPEKRGACYRIVLLWLWLVALLQLCHGHVLCVVLMGFATVIGGKGILPQIVASCNVRMETAPGKLGACYWFDFLLLSLLLLLQLSDVVVFRSCVVAQVGRMVQAVLVAPPRRTKQYTCLIVCAAGCVYIFLLQGVRRRQPRSTWRWKSAKWMFAYKYRASAVPVDSRNLWMDIYECFDTFLLAFLQLWFVRKRFVVVVFHVMLFPFLFCPACWSDVFAFLLLPLLVAVRL